MDDTLTVGISPCPNDTYIFGALATETLAFRDHEARFVLEDVEKLNSMARQGELDVCKVSVGAAIDILDRYVLLRAGGAMGRGVGPVLVASEMLDPQVLDGREVAIPGRMTTASLLLQLYCREQGISVETREMIFHEVMDSVESGEVKAGILIHEGRFTFEQRGLVKLADLGAWWEERYGMPLPLGVIAVRRELGMEKALNIQKAIQGSLALARQCGAPWEYIRPHAQEMDMDVIREHIETFVTDYSHDVGPDGERAVEMLIGEAARIKGRDAKITRPVFVPADSADPADPGS